MPVTIGSFSYIPPLPVESVVKERITEIAGQEKTAIDVVIELCLYCMKTQVFLDDDVIIRTKLEKPSKIKGLALI